MCIGKSTDISGLPEGKKVCVHEFQQYDKHTIESSLKEDWGTHLAGRDRTKELDETLILRANVLQSTNLLFSHGWHNRQNKVLPFSKSIFDLHTFDKKHKFTKRGGEKAGRNQRLRLQIRRNKKHQLCSLCFTCLSRESSVGSLKSSLVSPLSVRRLTCKNWSMKSVVLKF